MLGRAGRTHYVSMLTYWSIGQGIAVLLRHWIEELIKQPILHPRNRSRFGRPIEHVFTLRDLKRRFYLGNSDVIALAGEEKTEHSQSRSWKVPIRSTVIMEADALADAVVDAYERRPVGLSAAGPNWKPDRNFVLMMEEFHRKFPATTTAEQQKRMSNAALAPGNARFKLERLICNLIVLEKPPGKVSAFRFATPGLGSMRQLRDEKRNLLLLYGWLRQEKPFRLADRSVEVFWAHLLPRKIAPGQVVFFDESATMPHKQFWEYVGVPFEIVRDCLEQCGSTLRMHIRETIRQGAFDRVAKQLSDEPAA